MEETEKQHTTHRYDMIGSLQATSDMRNQSVVFGILGNYLQYN